MPIFLSRRRNLFNVLNSDGLIFSFTGSKTQILHYRGLKERGGERGMKKGEHGDSSQSWKRTSLHWKEFHTGTKRIRACLQGLSVKKSLLCWPDLKKDIPPALPPNVTLLDPLLTDLPEFQTSEAVPPTVIHPCLPLCLP